jgi:hypothetical protein
MTDLRARLQAALDDALARTPVEMTSSLAPDEIARRLTAAVDSDWVLFGSKPVVGRVDKRTFRLRRRIKYRNSFQTFLFGTMVADGRATRLNCRVGTHPIVAVLMAAWLLAVGGLLIGALASASAGAGEIATLFLAVPAAMIAFGVGLVWLGRWLARNEQRDLVAFLKDTVEAKLSR